MVAIAVSVRGLTPRLVLGACLGILFFFFFLPNMDSTSLDSSARDSSSLVSPVASLAASLPGEAPGSIQGTKTVVTRLSPAFKARTREAHFVISESINRKCEDVTVPA